MKARRKGKALTLGEFIVAVYDVCGKRRAEGVIRLAAQAHLIALPGQRYFTVS